MVSLLHIVTIDIVIAHVVCAVICRADSLAFWLLQSLPMPSLDASHIAGAVSVLQMDTLGWAGHDPLVSVVDSVSCREMPLGSG